MKRFTILPVFLLLPFLALSQSNYKKGLIVTLHGDTLTGYINDRDWTQNPSTIEFKDNPESTEEKIFSTENSSYFQIVGEEMFQRFSVKISLDPISLSRLQPGPDTSNVIKSVFLKLLVEGCHVNLYSFTDEIKTRFYFWDRSNERAVELSYKVFYYQPTGQANDPGKILTRKNYIGQLDYLAAQYAIHSKELQRKIEVVSYQKDQLAEIIMQINGNNATNFCEVHKLTEKGKLVLFAGLKLRRSTLIFMDKPALHNVNKGSDYNVSYFPSVGLGFDWVLNTGSRFYVREEISVSRDDLSSADQYSEPFNNYYENYQYSISQWNVTLSSGLNYNAFHGSGLKIFLGSGININYSRIPSSTYVSHGYDLYREYDNLKQDILPPSEFWMSVALKTGIIIKNKVEIGYIYNIPITITKAGGSSSRKISSMEFGISFFFNSSR